MASFAREIHDEMEHAAQEALLGLAEEVKRLAIENMPKGDPLLDPDPNVNLADLVEIERTPFGYEVSISAPYVIRQHENGRLQHPRGGGPKFLERAVTAVAPRMEPAMAARVHQRLASGRTFGRNIPTGR
jgi:hypothetical protein